MAQWLAFFLIPTCLLSLSVCDAPLFSPLRGNSEDSASYVPLKCFAQGLPVSHKCIGRQALQSAHCYVHMRYLAAVLQKNII